MSVTVLQVGEGRFLRAFLGAMVADAREQGAFHGRLLLTAPRPTGTPKLERLKQAGGRYRVIMRGPQGEQTQVLAPYDRIIDTFTEPEAVREELLADVPLVVVSNTTEAGLVYQPDDPTRPRTYPARLATWLRARSSQGLAAPTTVIPCELLADNARVLHDAVVRHTADWGWKAEEVLRGVTFAETLVDRIVTSEDPDDPLACFTEPYMAWYIGGAPQWTREALAFDPRHVHWVEDVTPARDRKVRLLNGTHTLMAAIGQQMGEETVIGALEHPDLGRLLRTAMLEEGVGSFPPAERPEARAFAEATLARLLNPGIRDTLARLSLQMSAKARARWTPILEGYRREYGRYPERFALGIAAYLRLAARPGAGATDLAECDDAAWIHRLRALWTTAAGVEAFVAAAVRDSAWPAPSDPELLARVAHHLQAMETVGVAAHVRAS